VKLKPVKVHVSPRHFLTLAVLVRHFLIIYLLRFFETFLILRYFPERYERDRKRKPFVNNDNYDRAIGAFVSLASTAAAMLDLLFTIIYIFNDDFKRR